MSTPTRETEPVVYDALYIHRNCGANPLCSPDEKFVRLPDYLAERERRIEAEEAQTTQREIFREEIDRVQRQRDELVKLVEQWIEQQDNAADNSSVAYHQARRVEKELATILEPNKGLDKT
jgi:hypothetical protein